jgi:CubicO group peptidase (beta-lactamase class C family)
MSKTKSKHGLLGIVILLGVLAVAVPLGYKLFEPVFVYRLDWSALPEGAYPVQSEIVDQRYAEQARAAQAALEAARDELQAPALSAAVSINGEIIWRSVVGYADVEALRPAELSTRFRLGSTSKAVTAVAVGTLLDQQRLNLDAPIQTYIPRFPEQRWPVTLRQVMSHRAGLRDYGMCFCFPAWEHLNQRRFANVDAEIDLIADAPLLFQPDTSFVYTSLGYNLTGAAVERASGEDFGAYLQRAVFAPLGMTQSGLDSIAGAEADRAAFYEVENGSYKRAFPVDNSIRWPSGGVLSTPTDMARLGAAMLDDRLLSATTRATLVTVPEGGRDARGGGYYALGWRTGEWTLYDGALSTIAHHHAGTAVGSSSVFVVFPEFGMVISLMMNKGGTSVDALAIATDRVAQAFIPRPAPE